MKGIVFHLLQHAVEQHLGAPAWDEILRELDLPGACTSVGSYDDREFLSLIEANGQRVVRST